MQGNFISIDEAENRPIEELLENLSSSSTGLSPSEAAAKLQQFGTNEIQETRISHFIGSPKPGKRGYGAASKAKVVVAVEVREDKLKFATIQQVESMMKTIFAKQSMGDLEKI
jgi:hypothetical protein